MKILLALFIAACAGGAQAQIVSRDSVHLKPLGSIVSGSFVLVNRIVPLPPGQFTLVATSFHDSKFIYGDYAGQQHKLVDVVLGQMADGKLRAAVVASGVLAWGGGRREWVSEPCKRDDTLFKLDRVPYMKRNYSQDCLMVNHYINSLGQAATGIYANTAAWIKEQGGTTPIPTAIYASVTRIEVGEYLAVHYVFNPEAYGCDSAPSTSWATSAWHKRFIAKDPEKRQFVDGVIGFGKAMQVRINEAFEGRRQVADSLAAATPVVLNCGAKPS